MGGVHIAWFSRVPKARRVSEANELQPFVKSHVAQFLCMPVFPLVILHLHTR